MSQFLVLVLLQLSVALAQSETDAFLVLDRASVEKRLAQSEAALEKGIQEYQAQRYPRAIEFLNLALEHNPVNGRVYFYLGRSYFKVEKYRESLRALELASGTDFDEAERFFLLSVARYRLEDYASALEGFQQVLDFGPTRYMKSSQTYVGLIQSQIGRTSEARSQMEQVIGDSDAELSQRLRGLLEVFDTGSEWYEVGGNLGVSYNSNPLELSESEKSGAQGQVAVHGAARFIDRASTSAFFVADVSMAKSFQRQFSVSDYSFVKLDVPFEFSSAGLWGIVPGYRIGFLDINRDGSAEEFEKGPSVRLYTQQRWGQRGLLVWVLSESLNSELLLNGTTSDSSGPSTQAGAKLISGSSYAMLEFKGRDSAQSEFTNRGFGLGAGTSWAVGSKWQASTDLSVESLRFSNIDRSDRIVFLYGSLTNRLSESLTLTFWAGLRQRQSNVSIRKYQSLLIGSKLIF